MRKKWKRFINFEPSPNELITDRTLTIYTQNISTNGADWKFKQINNQYRTIHNFKLSICNAGIIVTAACNTFWIFA